MQVTRPQFLPGEPMLWPEAQAFMQEYQVEHNRALDQLSFGVSQTDIDMVESWYKNMKTVGILPSVQVVNKSNPVLDQTTLSGIEMQYLNLPLRQLQELAQHPETYVRTHLALVLGKEKRHEKPFARLAIDEAYMVRRTVGQNMWCMSKVLRTMTSDEDVWVRRRIAYHRNATVPILRTMLEDDDMWVRTIAEHVLHRKRAFA